MSLWWAKRDQLDKEQIALIEDLSLRENHLVLGPPGSGKTNVLLRRAQFVRSQQMPNVLVITFTRALTEFIKTGCYDAQGREIFPGECVTTLESWIRTLYRKSGLDIPEHDDYVQGKRDKATGAIALAGHKIPQYDALFVDEAQDLLPEEVDLLAAWSPVLYFVGDDRQKIYEHSDGLAPIKNLVGAKNVHSLPWHYRLAPEICDMADRIMVAQGANTLAASSHYNGPKPGQIEAHGLRSRELEVADAAQRLKSQLRAYGDLIKQGDRLAIIVRRTTDRDFVYNLLEGDGDLRELSQIIRARTGSDDRDHNPEFDPEKPISILSEQASKGLEFRAVHWLFCDELDHHRTPQMCYTVVTRAKTSLDMYHSSRLPQTLAASYTPPVRDLW